MTRKPARSSSILRWLKHTCYPHPGNNHHPYAIRHHSLAVYVAILLLFNVSYNLIVAKNNQVLGFATAISQSALIQLTNQSRTANGVPPLTENAKLNQAAQLKAKNMFDEDYWAHYAPSGKSPWFWFEQSNYTYTVAGENLARDFDTSQGVINGWLNSPSHRANMLSTAYTEIGIAVMNGTLQGQPTTLVVQHFGKPLAAVTAPAPAQSNIEPQSPAPAPTVGPIIQEQPVHQQLQAQDGPVAGIPAISPSVLAAIPYQLLQPPSIDSLGLQQAVTILFLLGLIGLFLIDSGVLHRRNIQRENSHSLLHAGALTMMVLLILYSTTGAIL